MARKKKIGVVISSKMNKSIVVKITTTYKHSLYAKIMRNTKRYIVHDSENICKLGDTVIVEEHPPLSAKKRWILKTILK
jgi:small subunit ribosomal protein S17